MADNPFLPLSFIAGPAVLTNASSVLLNGASVRYNLAIGLWRDLQSELKGEHTFSVAAYADHSMALKLLYCAMGGFGLSTLTGLIGAVLAETQGWAVKFAIDGTLIAGGFGLVCLLAAAVTFIGESRCTLGLLRLGTPRLLAFRQAREVDSGV